MSSTSIFDMSLSSIWDCFNTPAYWIGFMSVCFLDVVFLLVFCWYLLIKRRQLLTLSCDGEGGVFKISLRAVRSHLRGHLRRRYPQLRMRKIGLCRYKGGVKVSVYVQVSFGENMQDLRSSIMSDLRKTLNGQMGMEGLFTGVDVIVSDLLASPEGGGAEGSEALGQPRFASSSPSVAESGGSFSQSLAGSSSSDSSSSGKERASGERGVSSGKEDFQGHFPVSVESEASPAFASSQSEVLSSDQANSGKQGSAKLRLKPEDSSSVSSEEEKVFL